MILKLFKKRCPEVVEPCQPSWWPNPLEISAALRDTKTAFPRNSKLFGSEPLDIGVANSPRPAGGGANSAVYRLRSQKQAIYALLFFRAPVTDHRHRFQAIKHHLSSVGRRGFLPFEFVERGLRVRNGAGENGLFPYLRMEWSAQKSLEDYVQENFENTSRMGQLALAFRRAYHSLLSREISHGDLHPGQILVRESKSLELVWLDYYPVFVPELIDPPPDLGLPNFLHPEAQTSRSWGKHVSAFPARVIYLSLLLIQKKPKLFEKFHMAGENLLFEFSDFKAPGRTELWREIHAVEEPRIQLLAVDLELSCRRMPKDIPAELPIFGERP